jgi:hypothetical protein
VRRISHPIRRQRGADASRAERTARIRRERARAHLARLRGRPAPARRLRGGRVAALVLAASGLAGVLAAGGLATQAPLRAIHVAGAQHVPARRVAAVALAPDAATLRGVAERLARHDWIAAAHTLPLPHGHLVVRVVERRPVAVLAGPEPWAIDASGTPFAPLDGAELPDLPRIVAAGPVTPREPDPRLAAAVLAARGLASRGLALAGLFVAAPDDPEGLALQVDGLRARVVLGGSGLDERLDALVRLIAVRPPELDSAARVDLRFGGQAVLVHERLPGGSAEAAGPRGRASPSNRGPVG